MHALIESLEARRLFATNLLSNGSFETPQIGVGASGQGYTDYAAGSVLGSAWKVTANSADIVSNKAGTSYSSKAENGNQCVDLAGFAPGTISQTVVTAASHEYELSFSWTATPFAGGGAPTVRTMNVTFGGKTIASLSKSVTGETPTNPGWQTSTYLVTATFRFVSGDIRQHQRRFARHGAGQCQPDGRAVRHCRDQRSGLRRWKRRRQKGHRRHWAFRLASVYRSEQQRRARHLRPRRHHRPSRRLLLHGSGCRHLYRADRRAIGMEDDNGRQLQRGP